MKRSAKKRAKKRALAPQGGNECVYTPPDLAAQIVKHFRPSGRALEPCAGNGAFVEALRRYSKAGQVSFCEIDGAAAYCCGLNFLECHTRVDWIVTNPPWGRKFRAFLNHSMELADNIVFLANMNVWDTKCRRREIAQAGFGIVEMLMVDTPPRPWPQQGFQLVATWLKRGWTGSTHTHSLT